MATPQESIVTVSGRRCTRSRARTAATSTLTSAQEITSILSTSTTTTTDAQSIQSSSVADAPPPPPSSTSSTETPEQATSAEAISSTLGTSSAVSSTVAQSSLLANVAPQVPAAAVPAPVPEVIESTSVKPVAVDPTSALPATPTPTNSDTNPTALLPTSSASAELAASSAIAPIVSSSAILPDEPAQSVLPQDPSPEQSQPTDTGIPTGGSAGVISPDTGTPEEGSGLTLPLTGQTNVASIAGGVVGGFVGLALISALLFFCLRRRKTGTFEKWQQRMSEKNEGEGGFLTKLRMVPEKVKNIPAGVRIFIAKIKGNKSGPTSNPYRRHTIRSSVSSVYSVGTNRRSQSISEPPSKFRQQLRGFGDRMPSLKRSRTLLQKKQDSLVIGQKSPFPGIVEDPVVRNSNGIENPFQDPLDPPKNLQLLNPDPASPQLQDQQRGPITPKPAATSERNSRDPFASLLEEIDAQNGSGTPEWLRETAQQHKRTTSSQTALRSHPTSKYTASVYTDAENPFFDPSDPPPVPTQPLPPNPPVRPANAYAPLPQFNATSSTVSRISKDSFFFGEPGPSRPATNMYGSRVRQSDPFDLDRPEVLGFGNVGGRTVRGSVTRQNSRKRSSTVPNWINVDDGPYEPGSAALRNPSFKRKQQR
ncbi:hypothetical protein N0V90_002338 [Kalmusia sp. IMI 367209]|nr:hypothetical protein N0V90_002338 [Kalmusia sp. IMI 367209]